MKALGLLTDRHWETEQILHRLSQEIPHFPERKLIGIWDEKSRHRFMLMERRHEQTFWQELYGQPWSSMSSGEKKLRWIEHELGKRPVAFYIEYPWAHLDQAKAERLNQLLLEAAQHTFLICAWGSKAEIPTWISEVRDIREAVLLTNAVSGIEKDFPRSAVLPKKEQQNQPLVSLKKVSVSFLDKPILDSVDWTIFSGEVWALKGPNGSGKSTLIELITSDNPKGYQQDVTLFGQPKGKGSSVWDIKKNIGYYTPSQLDYFHQNVTVQEMIIGGLKDQVGLYELPSSIDRQKTDEWIRWAGLETYTNKLFLECSPGIQALIMTVRALIKMPPLVILDEAHAAMDQSTVDWWLSLLESVKKHSETSLILVSHDLTPSVVDHVLTLHPAKTGSTAAVTHL